MNYNYKELYESALNEIEALKNKEEPQTKTNNMNNNQVRTMQDWTPAEYAIYNAMQEVERMGAHPLLTEVVTLLGQAKDKMAECVAENPVGVNTSTKRKPFYETLADLNTPLKNE